MRIAYVTETYPPEVNGVSYTAERALRHLRLAGHAVQLVRPRQAGEGALDSAAEWRCGGGPLPLYRDLRFGWAGRGALRRRWRHGRPDLVHVATPGPLAWAALRAARAEGIATSADYRTNFHAYSRHYGVGWLEPVVLGWLRRLHALADCNFVPTQSLARQLAALGFERLQVVGRGVDAARFSPVHRSVELRRSWGVDDDTTPVLLHVGRLAPEKNVAVALRAYERLRSACPALRLVVVGDGPLRQRLAADHPQVHFAGLQSGQPLSAHYASADVFLFPSLTDTFGNVTLEAMASGLAVVAFDTAAAQTHVRDGISGFLAVPARGDVQEAFSAAAERALQVGALATGSVRRQARAAALRADWDVVLRGFDQRLRAVVADTAVRRVRHAALA